MGTSAACMWATIYFAVHEIETLIPKYSANLMLFVCFIDGMFGIWTGNDAAWEAFQQDTNNFGILTWEFETLSLSVDFLNLTINIEDIKSTSKTYQETLNLYQYLMSQSNQPPCMIKGIIFSLMQNYRHQYTFLCNYNAMNTKRFYHHITRGWDQQTTKPWILKVDHNIQTEESVHPPTPGPSDDTTANINACVFLHFEYHLNNMPKKTV